MTTEHHMGQERKIPAMNTSRVEQMIAREGNVIPLDDEKRQCGDGRSNENGAVSIFGADALPMQVLATMNTGMTPEETVQFVIGINTDRGQKTFFHTDTHTQINNVHDIGCGQLKKPSIAENENLYKMDQNHILKSSDAQRIITELNKQEARNPKNVIRKELYGDHLERGVIFNTGKENTIRHDDGTDQVFVVDTKAAEKYLREIFAEIVKRKPEFTGREEEFMNVANHLTNTTAKLLANHLPIFEINVDTENSYVKLIGTVA